MKDVKDIRIECLGLACRKGMQFDPNKIVADAKVFEAYVLEDEGPQPSKPASKKKTRTKAKASNESDVLD